MPSVMTVLFPLQKIKSVRIYAFQHSWCGAIVDFRINETLQTGAVGNRTYRVGESVYLFLEFTKDAPPTVSFVGPIGLKILKTMKMEDILYGNISSQSFDSL